MRAYVALEFAYTESPFAMQGMVMGLNHLTTGLGALLGSALYNAAAVITDLAGNAIDTTTATTTTATVPLQPAPPPLLPLPLLALLLLLLPLLLLALLLPLLPLLLLLLPSG